MFWKQPSSLSAPRVMCLLACASGLSVGAVSPTVTSLNPPGGKAGTEVEVILGGNRLDDAKELLVYSSGLKVKSLEAKSPTKVRAVLSIDDHCAFGEHQLRLRTLSGLSEIRTFFVGPFQTIPEKEPNNDPSKAQMVPLNTTLAGTITSEDVDYFKLPAKKGDRLSVEIEAIQLGRAMFDSYVSVLDPQGVPLATCDDSVLRLQDAVISLLIPADGFYQVLVRDSSWGGGDEFSYRLHLGSFPRPTIVYPLGGPAGKDLEVTFLGDPKRPLPQRLKLPDQPTDDLALFAEADGLRSPSGNRFRVVSFPNVLETDGNQERAKATASAQPPPVAFNGIVAKPGEQDWFSFTALKKQPLDIVVYARRLRSPLDSVLQLCDAKGKVIDTNDDGAGPDSVLKFTPEETGVYFLRISDQLGGGGPDYVYRVEVTPPSPKVVLSIPEVARNDTQSRQYVAIPRGNRMATLLRAKRTHFNGDLKFDIPGLPSGVTLQAEVMPAGVDLMPWVFKADSEADLVAALVRPAASSSGKPTDLTSTFRHTLELVRGNNDQVFYGTYNERLAVAVVQEVPFQIKLEPPSTPLVRAGNLKVKVSAERRPGFEDPITVKMLWNPPGITSDTEITIPKGKTLAEYSLTAKGDAPVSLWKVVALGSASYKGGTVFAASDLTPLRVTEPFILGKITTVSTEPGSSFQLKCQLDQREPFEGKATVRLLGLPDKAHAEDQEITKEDKEVVFQVTLDPKIPTGSHKNLACQVLIRQGADTIVQTVGSGGVLRIVPPKKTLPAPKKLAATEATPPAK